MKILGVQEGVEISSRKIRCTSERGGWVCTRGESCSTYRIESTSTQRLSPYFPRLGHYRPYVVKHVRSGSLHLPGEVPGAFLRRSLKTVVCNYVVDDTVESCARRIWSSRTFFQRCTSFMRSPVVSHLVSPIVHLPPSTLLGLRRRDLGAQLLENVPPPSLSSLCRSRVVIDFFCVNF